LYDVEFLAISEILAEQAPGNSIDRVGFTGTVSADDPIDSSAEFISPAGYPHEIADFSFCECDFHLPSLGRKLLHATAFLLTMVRLLFMHIISFCSSGKVS
jgi:hypothetical protein